MSLRIKSSNGDETVHANYLSSNHKVMHYLENSTACSKLNSIIGLHHRSTNNNGLIHLNQTELNASNRFPDRLRSSSDNGSFSSVPDTLSRSDLSLGSSISEPGGYYSNFSSNTSSSGVFSTFSELGHEETTSNSSEELDFNLAFDRNSDHNEIEIANLDEIDDIESDDCGPIDVEHCLNSKKNSIGQNFD